MKNQKGIISFILSVLIIAGICFGSNFLKGLENAKYSVSNQGTVKKSKTVKEKENKFANLKYTGDPYIEVNGNCSSFTDEELTKKNYIKLSELDELGRCSTAEACVSKKDMPNKERGSIGMVKPSGWHTVRYDGLVQGNYLYNRCHLLAYSISGLLADERNLITGTRYMNIEGMCDQEEIIRNYVRNTGNHVLYRVTPVFKGNELVARGVLMEAKSVEDNGKGVDFNNYAFNVQPGIIIDYATGDSKRK